MQVYPEVDLKKKIKTKLDLSDGNNIITCMMSEKIYNSFVRNFAQFKITFSISNSLLRVSMWSVFKLVNNRCNLSILNRKKIVYKLIRL